VFILSKRVFHPWDYSELNKHGKGWKKVFS
jgi:hypothetical protein